MRLLFVLAHPLPESFTAALCAAAITAARGCGHEARLIDLYAEGFNPVMSPDERRGYADGGPPPTDLAPHVQALTWAEGLIFVYPTWWSTQPAMLKGWLDRVWRPGIAFTVAQDGTTLRPGLANIRLLGVITTLGVPWWLWTFALGAPGRKALLRGLRPCTAPRSRTFWLALHGMDRQGPAARARHIEKVRARIARIPV